MKLIYFHGFASSGASGTVQLLRKMLPSAEVIAPDIPVDPEEALPMLHELVETEQPDIIVGTSMGGMYAQQMHGHLRVCVNPAFRMSTMSKTLHTGEHKWLNGRKDSAKTFRVTADTLKHFNQMERKQFDGITPDDKDLCYGLASTTSLLIQSMLTTLSPSITITQSVLRQDINSTKKCCASTCFLCSSSCSVPSTMRLKKSHCLIT